MYTHRSSEPDFSIFVLGLINWPNWSKLMSHHSNWFTAVIRERIVLKFGRYILGMYTHRSSEPDFWIFVLGLNNWLNCSELMSHLVNWFTAVIRERIELKFGRYIQGMYTLRSSEPNFWFFVLGLINWLNCSKLMSHCASRFSSVHS